MSRDVIDGADSHLSIGEVLAALRKDFPDITISKIRFLESQGLIDPERTPSGYRRFYTPDLERLRWILLQQRDHFLPLRVIKERLDEFGPDGAPVPRTRNGAPSASHAPSSSVPAPPPSAASPARPFLSASRPTPEPMAPRSDPASSSFDDVRDALAAEDVDEALDAVPDDSTGHSGFGLTRVELLEATGLSDAQLDELESFGIVLPISGDAGRPMYDDEALAIAEIGAGYYRRGVEARHLKMFVHSGEREAALFAQVLLPYVRQRNPSARARLVEELEDLARLGRQLRTAMLRRALRQTLTE
jgi:DNA-binding transcriptional MerR regulator